MGGRFFRRRSGPVRTRGSHADYLRRRLHWVRADIARCARADFLPGKALRVTAGRLAYVDLLIEACELFDVEHELAQLAGTDRQLEVLRVEAALDEAGLPLTSRL
jgi:hypothetical protein